MKRRLRAATIAAFAAAALTLTACQGGAENDDSGLGEGEGADTLTFGDVELIKQYNTSASDATLYDTQFVGLLQDGFIYYDDALELQRDEDFGTFEKTSDDPLVVTYTINDDRNWSDGEPVTATDMYLEWAATSGQFNTAEAEFDEEGEISNQDELDENVFFNATSPSRELISEVELSEDDKSITFTYSKPYADWELTFGSVGVPAHVMGQQALEIEDATEARTAVREAIANNDGEALAPISGFWNTGFQFDTQMPEDESLYLSNGRYTLTNWQAEQFQTFTAVQDYPGSQPAGVETVTVRKIADVQAMIQALENGEIDAFSTQQVSVDLVQGAEGLGENFTAFQQDAASYGHLDLAFKGGGPFSAEAYDGDEAKALAVRQAFLKVFPRQELVDKLVVPLNENATLRNSFTQVPGSPFYDGIASSNGLADYTEPDVAGATQLLEDAGVETPINVRFLFSSQSEERAQQFQIATQALEDSGLFTTEDRSSADWSSLLADPSGWDATMFGWISTSTAVTESDANFRTDAVNNRQGYSNPEVDALFDELQVETDSAEQERILTEIEKLVAADAFGYPFAQAAQLSVYNNTKVEGMNPLSIVPTIYWNPWEWKLS